jgi:hypothetical protein
MQFAVPHVLLDPPTALYPDIMDRTTKAAYKIHRVRIDKA